MKIALANSDVVSSYKASFLSSIVSYSIFKNKFFKLLETHRVSITSECANFIAKFKSPVNDGWLNSNKSVADVFLSSYKYGERHWDGDLDHLYPFVRLYPFDAQEAAKYAKYLDSFVVLSDVYAWSPCPYGMVGPMAEDGSFIEERYVERWEDSYVEYVYYADSASYEEVVHTTKYEKYFLYNLEKMRTMGGVNFFEWFCVPNRVDFEVEKAEGSWYDNTLFHFALSIFTGGMFGGIIFVLSTTLLSLFSKKDETHDNLVDDKNIWSFGDSEDLDILAIPPLPKY